MKKKDWKSLLISKAEEDGAKCLKIYGKNIDDCDKIQRRDTCTAICNCGEGFSKNIRQLVEKSGLFCDKCTAMNALKKVKTTNLERRGVEHPSQSQEVKDKIKETCFEKYGVENPMQNREIFEKAQKNAKKLKEYIFASGETIHCQGDEPWALEELEELHGYTYDDYTNNTSFWYIHDEIPHRYHTDIEY